MKLEIRNFKSIKNEKINLDRKIYYLVGANESGKSNFLSAIKAINETKIEHDDKNFNINYDETNEKSEIIFEWNISDDIKKEWSNIGYKRPIIMKGVIDEINKKAYFVDESLSKWIFKQLSKNYKIDSEYEKQMIDIQLLNSFEILEGKEELEIKENIINLIKKSSEINNSIIISYFKEFDLIKRDYTFEEAINSKCFLSLWKLLNQNNEDIEKLRDYDTNSNEFNDLADELQEKLQIKFQNFISSFWGQKTIKFHIKIKDYGFLIRAADSFENDDNNSKYVKLDYRSDGMKHYLTIILFINSIINENEGKKNIVLFDEPDKLLHSRAVMDLKKYFEKISNKNFNFVIATHNPYFIDENNFHEISFVSKKSLELGSKIIKDFARKSNNEMETTITPFLTKIGIDTKAFISLSEDKIVFVEGFQDLILLNYAYIQMKDKHKLLEKIRFIPLGSATKMPGIVNLSISFGNKLPYFIFDYDKSGNDGMKLYKRNKFIINDLKNWTFVNGRDEFNNNKSTIETQDIFDDTKYNDKKISENKNTTYFIEYASKIKKGEISLNSNTIESLKILFGKIKNYYEKIEKIM